MLDQDARCAGRTFLLVAPIHTARRTTGGGQRTLHLFRSLLRLGVVDVLLLSDTVTAPLELDLHGFRTEFDGARSLDFARCADQFLLDTTGGARGLPRLKHVARRLLHVLRPRSVAYAPRPVDVRSFRNRTIGAGYSAILGRYLQPTALSGALEQSTVPVIVDLDDLDEQLLRTRLLSPTTGWAMKAILAWQLIQLPTVLRGLRSRCAHLFVASETDRNRLPKFPVTVLPNVPFGNTRLVPDSKDSRVLLFVGTRAHRPNLEGLRHFVHECWPAIRSRVPDARCRIVGSGGWSEGDLAPSTGVELVGLVDDLDAEYAAAALCIAPILEGSGTKIKVLEALAKGRCVVATTHAIDGLDDMEGNGVFVAASSGAFADFCCELLLQTGRREAAASAGFAAVAASYSVARFDRIVATAVAGAVP